MDINARLEHILKKHGWTKYKLSKESKLPESTLSNIFHRGTVPTIATLQTICETMNITLSEFFSDDDKIVMTPELKEFYDEWLLLTPEKRKHIIQTMKYMK
ncbi:MAG: helix-turn-helix transcriptional regulator [Clostridia bacterium]|nr:helix-turn-helix transcriptional regulator [Clostridia bacterium]